MEDKNRKPKLRFKGFIEDWQERKLGEVCTLITKQTGFDYSATIKPALVKEKSDETYSFIQNKDFEGENINLDTDFYIPIKVAEKFPKIILDTPSLLISISGKIGNIGYYKLEKKSFIGGAVAVCKLKKDNGSIIAYSLQSDSGQAYFHSFVKASSHANITVEDIRKIIAKLPCSLDEQCKVSNFLYNIDNLITLQQNKYDKLLNIKKSMLEKMFPKENSDVPEIRFKGFTDKWEERRLGDICQITMGQSPAGITYRDTPADFILVQGNADLKSGWVYPRTWTTQKTKTACVGDLIMSVRAPAGAMGKTAYNVVLGVVWQE